MSEELERLRAIRAELVRKLEEINELGRAEYEKLELERLGVSIGDVVISNGIEYQVVSLDANSNKWSYGTKCNWLLCRKKTKAGWSKSTDCLYGDWVKK